MVTYLGTPQDVYFKQYKPHYCCNNNNNKNNNEFISYPFYMKLDFRPKIIYTKKKYYTIMQTLQYNTIILYNNTNMSNLSK